MKVGEIFVALGFDVDDKALDSFHGKVKAFKKTIRDLTLALTAALYAMDRFVDSSVRGAVAMLNFARQTGLSAQRLQQWQIAAQLSNIAMDADQVTSSIANLQQQLVAIRMGAGNTAPFQLLGIDIRDMDAFSVLDQLRERLRGVPDDVAVNLISQMGLGPDFINVLRLSQKEFESLARQFQRPQGVIDSIHRTGKAVRELKLGFSVFKDTLVAKLEPFWKLLISLLDRAGKMMGNILDFLDPMIVGFGALALSVGALVPIFRLLHISILPLTLTLAALMAILEDFAVYKAGGKSLIGEALKFAEGPVRKLKETFDMSGNQQIKDRIAELKAQGMGDFEARRQARDEFYATPAPTAEAMSEEDQRLMRELYPDDENYTPARPVFPEWGAEPPLLPPGGATPSGSGERSMNLNMKNDFHVSSNGAPEDTANAIARVLQRQMDYAVSDLNNKVFA